MPALPTSDESSLMDGILVAASEKKLSLIRVIKRDTHDQCLLLCTEFSNRNNIQLIPIAEIVVGNDVNELYIFPDEVRGMVDSSHEDEAIEVGISGFDKL